MYIKMIDGYVVKRNVVFPESFSLEGNTDKLLKENLSIELNFYNDEDFRNDIVNRIKNNELNLKLIFEKSHKIEKIMLMSDGISLKLKDEEENSLFYYSEKLFNFYISRGAFSEKYKLSNVKLVVEERIVNADYISGIAVKDIDRLIVVYSINISAGNFEFIEESNLIKLSSNQFHIPPFIGSVKFFVMLYNDEENFYVLFPLYGAVEFKLKLLSE